MSALNKETMRSPAAQSLHGHMGARCFGSAERSLHKTPSEKSLYPYGRALPDRNRFRKLRQDFNLP